MRSSRQHLINLAIHTICQGYGNLSLALRLSRACVLGDMGEVEVQSERSRHSGRSSHFSPQLLFVFCRDVFYEKRRKQKMKICMKFFVVVGKAERKNRLHKNDNHAQTARKGSYMWHTCGLR